MSKPTQPMTHEQAAEIRVRWATQAFFLPRRALRDITALLAERERLVKRVAEYEQTCGLLVKEKAAEIVRGMDLEKCVADLERELEGKQNP